MFTKVGHPSQDYLTRVCLTNVSPAKQLFTATNFIAERSPMSVSVKGHVFEFFRLLYEAELLTVS